MGRYLERVGIGGLIASSSFFLCCSWGSHHCTRFRCVLSGLGHLVPQSHQHFNRFRLRCLFWIHPQKPPYRPKSELPRHPNTDLTGLRATYMKTKYIVGIAVLTALLTTLALVPLFARGNSEPIVVTHETVVYVTQPTLSSSQTIWLAKLMQCESGIKGGAINPNDLDNTPSYGILQFKPSTFTAAAIELKLASTTDYMNPASQVAIVTHWILQGGIEWEQQFPACVAKLGPPPVK